MHITNNEREWEKENGAGSIICAIEFVSSCFINVLLLPTSETDACLIVFLVFLQNNEDFQGNTELAENNAFYIMAVNSPFHFQPFKD